MLTTILTIITAVLGIISTIVAWNLNPRRRTYEEIDSIDKKLISLYEKRDQALQLFNSNQITITTNEIIELGKRRVELLRRLV